VIGLTSDFNRAIKEKDIPLGANQVGWTTTGQGGFAAFGGDRSVNFGGAAGPIIWTPNQGILGVTLILGHSSADSKVTVVNPIDLGGFPRTVLVNNGSAAVDGEFSGVISGGGELNKTGTGTLDLTGNNTYGAATNVLEGTLRIKGLHNGSNNDVTVSSGSTLILDTTGQLAFAPAANGVSKKITGAGTATLNGTLFFKLGGANLTNGNSWTIVDAVGAASNLAGVASFPALTWNESPSGVWKAVDGSNTWTYTESSGTLGLVVSASVNYDSWAIANGISGAAFTDDADNDGIDNGTEYAIGGIPTSFTAPAALVPSGADFTLTYAKGTEAAADPQIDYVFETSPDLGTWTEVAPTSENASSVSYTLVKSGPARFVRLKIVRIIP
jgi:autotransporter-associated beta strand protein